MTWQPEGFDVDGVPVLTGRPLEGRYAGGLVFRVGVADETLPTRGITHLVEHLALQHVDLARDHANGMTAPAYTHFHVSGTLEEVVRFLTRAAAALRSLPVERLETEKAILRTEAAGRSWGPAPGMAAWRYGATGYGLTSYEELGLDGCTADDVREWASTWFTRGNAAAWITSPTIPAGLSLQLPEGRAMPMPAVTSALPEQPAYFQGRPGIVVRESVVRRSTAATVFAGVAERALVRDLRQDGGYSYTATCSYEPRDGSHAYLWAAADALETQQDAVVGGIVDAFAALRWGAIREEDLVAAVAKARESIEHPHASTLRLPSDALSLLIGHVPPDLDEWRAELDAVDEAALRAVAAEAQATALMQVPAAGVEWAGYAQAPSSSEAVVSGTSFGYLGAPEVTVVVGAEGVSFTGAGSRSTVRWDRLAAVQAYEDGGRVAIGLDGFMVRVEPTLLTNGTAAVAAVDQHAPAGLIVPVPARDAAQIPQPDPAGLASISPGRPGLPRRFGTVLAWSCLVLTLLAAIGVAGLAMDVAHGTVAHGEDWGTVAFGVGLVLVVGAFDLWLFRRRRPPAE